MMRPSIPVGARLVACLCCLGFLHETAAGESTQNRAPLQPQPYARLLLVQTNQWHQYYADGKGDCAYPQHIVNVMQGLKTPPLMYLVFEFWTQTFLGKSKGSFTAPAQGPNNGLQVFAIREARHHPWVLSTTRHISQGGVSLLNERWDSGSNVLSGKSAVVVGDPYVLTVHLPDGYRLKRAEVGGEKAEFANQKQTATVHVVPSATKTIEWKMTFADGAKAGDQE